MEVVPRHLSACPEGTRSLRHQAMLSMSGKCQTVHTCDLPRSWRRPVVHVTLPGVGELLVRLNKSGLSCPKQNHSAFCFDLSLSKILVSVESTGSKHPELQQLVPVHCDLHSSQEAASFSMKPGLCQRLPVAWRGSDARGSLDPIPSPPVLSSS